MTQTELQPLPPDVIDEPEGTEPQVFQLTEATPTDPPTSPTVPPE
jgi:hypothetical protein